MNRIVIKSTGDNKSQIHFEGYISDVLVGNIIEYIAANEQSGGFKKGILRDLRGKFLKRKAA